ncbi:MAG: class I SAM-dependent methyltransferase [Candidatus Hadarchaeum sp.]|uniref:class I SAM-dependent methyltransferase n=1 Tax=Candidatus Hadarchaeum sp. TaxID=2883567 RepID=UPI003D0D5979
MIESLRRVASKTLYVNMQKILSLAEEKKGCNFLDIGCGGGEFTLDFARKIGASNIYGVEISKTKIIEAKKRGIITKRADANKKLPFKDKFFDVILCNQVAEHLFDPDTLFEEIYRIMKDNGYAIVSVPNLASLHNRILLLLGFHPTSISPSTRFAFGNPDRGRIIYPFERHITAFSPRALKEMLEHYGFRVEMHGSGFYPFSGGISCSLSRIHPTLSVLLIAKVRKRSPA